MEKGNRSRVLPMAPEFAEFLRQTADNKRHGYVFAPLPRRQRYGDRLSAEHIGRVVTAIGKAANVKVSATATKVKYASAHDLRRSFGERWSSRVLPQILMELMRHESIATTMLFYVGEDARRTSAVLWEAHRVQPLGAILGAIELSDA